MSTKTAAAGRAPPVPVKTAATNVIRGLDKIAVDIAYYFAEEESTLSTMLSLSNTNERMERDAILTEIVKHVTSTADRVDEFLALQTRWMIDQKAAKAHVKMLQSKHDFSLSKINSQCELQHTGIVAAFKVKGNFE
jgi:hypothetical protein